MDAIYDKQKDLIQKYISLSEEDQPCRKTAVDLRQEINRNYHIFNHQLRSQFNWVGRYLGAGVLGCAGILYGQYSIKLYQRSSINLLLKSYLLFPSAGAMIGYLYVRKMHSNYNDGANNKIRLNNFIEENNSKIRDAEKKIEDKLKVMNN